MSQTSDLAAINQIASSQYAAAQSNPHAFDNAAAIAQLAQYLYSLLNNLTTGTATLAALSVTGDETVGGNLSVTGYSVDAKLPIATKAATAKVGSQTATAAQLAGGIITVDTSGGAANLTTDIATAIDTQFVGLAVGDTFQVQVLALGANAVTLLGGTNVTVTAPTVAANSSRIFTFRKTATGAYTTY